MHVEPADVQPRRHARPPEERTLRRARPRDENALPLPDRPMRVAVISDVHANEARARRGARGDRRSRRRRPLVPRRRRRLRACSRTAAASSSPPAPTLCLIGNHDLVALGKLDVDELQRRRRRPPRCWTRDELTRTSRAFLSPLEPRRHGTASSSSTRARATRSGSTSCQRRRRLSQPARDDRAARPRRPQPRRARDRARRRPSCTGAWRPADTEIELKGRWLLNPGSVGQPRDGDPRAAWLRARRSSAPAPASIASRIRSSGRRQRCASEDCPARSPSGCRTASRARRPGGVAPHRPRRLRARPLPRHPCRR